MGIFGRRKNKPDPYAASLSRAIPAKATVANAQVMSHSSNDVNESSRAYIVELDVEQPGGGVARRKVQWTVFNVALPDVQHGVTLDVTVDPERPDVVYPPGYPPPNMKPGVISLGDARILPTSKWLDDQLR
jgi:hypothetical protein